MAIPKRNVNEQVKVMTEAWGVDKAFQFAKEAAETAKRGKCSSQERYFWNNVIDVLRPLATPDPLVEARQRLKAFLDEHGIVWTTQTVTNVYLGEGTRTERVVIDPNQPKFLPRPTEVSA